MTGDPCCWICKTPSGVCATGHTCDHHKAAEHAQYGPTRLTYRDPTGNKAASNVDQQRRKKGGRR